MLHGDDQTSVQFAHDENHLYFNMNKRLLVSRMLAGQFPNFDLVIPRNLEYKLIFDAMDLKLSINRVNVLADEVSKRILFNMKDGTLTLRTENIKKGEAEEEIEISYDGKLVSLGFNSQYLLEF